MTHLVNANYKITRNHNEMVDTGRKTIFGDPILVRAQKYIEPNTVFDLDEFDADTQASFKDRGIYTELTDLEMALHEKIEASREPVSSSTDA